MCIRDSPPLEAEQTHRDRPPGALTPDDVFRARVRPVEEDLVEVAGAGHLLDGPHLDTPRLVHGDEQEAEAVMAPGVRIRAGQHEAPVRLVGQGGPDLLPADPVRPVRGPLRLGTDPGEVRTRAGFAVPLAPQLLAARDRRQEPGLLLVGPMGEQRRGQQFLPDVPGARRSPRPRVLLGPGDLLGQCGRAVAVPVLAPAEPDPARFPEGPFPGTTVPRAADVRGEPLPGLGAKVLVLDGKSKVH